MTPLRPPAKVARQRGYVIASDSVTFRFTLPQHDFDPPPGLGVLLESTPLAPAAHDVFTPAELAERIAAHAERVAREEPPASARAACYACGTRAPNGNRGLRALGWRLRGEPKLIEMYCGSCFEKWGWPDEGRVKA